MAVNVAANQFADKSFADSVTQTLDRYGLDPALLEIEITESLLLQDIEQVSAVLDRLRNHGVKIALDDFGTGYSSLSQLHTLPLDVLKIDRSFVSRLDFELKPSLPVTSTIVRMAKEYQLEIVAEGAETEAQVRILEELNVDLVQGYFFSKPVPADQVLVVLESLDDLGREAEAA